MSLLTLPTELIDNIAGSLEYTLPKSLYATKKDLLSLSLTCTKLRESAVPLLFRDAALDLCWDGSVLVEPRICELRAHDYFRHIQCLYIRTHYPARYYKNFKDFTVPVASKDWLNSGGRPDFQDDPEYRSRIDSCAQRLCSGAMSEETTSNWTAERLIIQSKQAGLLAVDMEKLDALAIVMLCVPRTTNKIVFESLSTSNLDDDHHRFALTVLGIAIEALRDRIRDITVLIGGGPSRTITHSGNNLSNPLSAEVMQHLRSSRLCLAAFNQSMIFPLVYQQPLLRWQILAPTLLDLELMDFKAEPGDLTHFIRAFPHLKNIRLHSCELDLRRIPGTPIQNDRPLWLEFVIDFRRSFPVAQLHLNGPRLTRGGQLPDGAVRWLLKEAIPEQADLTYDREQRLAEDFISFLPLWKTEDGIRGSKARSFWVEDRGKLVDLAMSRRRWY